MSTQYQAHPHNQRWSLADQPWASSSANEAYPAAFGTGMFAQVSGGGRESNPPATRRTAHQF